MSLIALRIAGAAAVSWLLFIASAVGAPLKVDAEQARALQLRTAAPQPVAEGGVLKLQGQVQWPPGGLRVLSAPVDAVVQQVHVGAGDAVPARRALVRLESPELVAWQRDHREAQLQRDQARSVAERDARLLEEGLIPAQRAQASRTALDSAEATLHERQQRLQLSGVRPDAGLSGQAAVLAPLAGRVAELFVQPGQRVPAGTPLLSLALPGPLWLVLQAPAEAAARLQVGDRVQVPGCAGTHAARIQTLHVQVDPVSQLRWVRAVWPDAPACVLPGQRVEAEVRLGGAGAAAWWLPAAALVRQDGLDQVYLQRDGGYEAVPVQRLAQDADGRVQVRPLQGQWRAQDRIVVQGAVALKGLAAGLSGAP